MSFWKRHPQKWFRRITTRRASIRFSEAASTCGAGHTIDEREQQQIADRPLLLPISARDDEAFGDYVQAFDDVLANIEDHANSPISVFGITKSNMAIG